MNELAWRADRLLKRAAHMEQRASRAPRNSNDRRKCLAKSVLLRGLADQLHKQASDEARKETE